MDTVWFVITTVIGGAIIGGIAQLLIPGKATIGKGLTVLAGIVGMLLGSFIYWKLFGHDNAAFDGHAPTWDNTTNGIDWLRHLWQVGTAVVAVIVTGGLAGLAGKKGM